MKFRGLITAVVVFAGLVGTLYWSNHRKSAEDTVKASRDTPPTILSLDQADIDKIDIKKKGHDELVLARNNSGKWEMTAPQSLGVDQDAVASMISNLSSLNSERLVEDQASNPGQYGLSEPALEVDVATKNNKTHKLLIGDDTPTGSGAYAALAGDRRVFTIASYSKSNIDKSANDLRDKRLLIFEADKISRVELVRKQQGIEFGRDKDNWQILKPTLLRADSLQVGELVRKLAEAKMELSPSDQDAGKIASAFAAGSLVATAKVVGPSGTQELQVRKNKDDYYAKSSAVAGAYRVSNDLGQSIDKTLDDFRNKKLFDFSFSDPNKIEIHDGSKAYFLTRNGGDWWSGSGKKMDLAAVQSLIDKIRELSATKFVDRGFGTPVVDMTVTSNDGKRLEKVLIAKDGDNYLAKRQNEPTLYALDLKSVEDLQRSASGLKPAEAAAK